MIYGLAVALAAYIAPVQVRESLLAPSAGTRVAPTITCDPKDPEKCECNGTPIRPHTWKPPAWLVTNFTSIYETSAPIFGKNASLSNYRAKATLVMNVASA